MLQDDHMRSRYWTRRGESPRLDYDGFLLDPPTEWGALANPACAVYDCLASTPCLILLGEPGTGKSTAITAAFAASNSANDGSTSLLFNLNEYQTQSELIEAITENRDFKHWLELDHRLVLFLDSLDEFSTTSKPSLAALRLLLTNCQLNG